MTWLTILVRVRLIIVILPLFDSVVQFWLPWLVMIRVGRDLILIAMMGLERLRGLRIIRRFVVVPLALRLLVLRLLLGGALIVSRRCLLGARLMPRGVIGTGAAAMVLAFRLTVSIESSFLLVD